MCGRYTLSKTEHLAEKLREAGFNFEEFSHLHITPRFNIAPTQQIPVIFSHHTLGLARWGLIPSWAKDEKIASSLINARAETVATKPAFRSAFKRHRCLIPADGFYEWQQTPSGKQPYRFTLADSALFTFAGLWEEWNNPEKEKIRTCTIITTTPNDLVAPIHNRMPVILPPAQAHTWLDSSTPLDTLTSLLTPLPADQMRAYPVTPAVGNARHDHPALITPLPS